MEQIQKVLSYVNNSKLFAGLAMIMLNIGSKYISLDLTPAQEKILKENLGRQLLVFAISWMGSRDIVIALILTGTFHVLTMYLLNESSELCVLPEQYKKMSDVIDTDGDGNISEDEIQKAIHILESARKKEENKIQSTMTNNFVQQPTTVEGYSVFK